MADYALARRNMVDAQLRTNKVVAPAVIAAFSDVPRERFVAPQRRPVAYVDEDLPLGDGRYLMEPMVLARLIQALDLHADDVVLNVGCGSGYSTAILARLAGTVVAVESDARLAREANALLTELSVDNAVVVEGPLPGGHAKQAPYNAILVGGAVTEVSDSLTGQLAEGGRMGVVVDEAGESGVGRAMLLLKSGGVVSGRPLFDAATPLLPGFQKEMGFVF
jgi:protein-L-isoaspartate(D-aspartate) O-methyltransferase